MRRRVVVPHGLDLVEATSSPLDMIDFAGPMTRRTSPSLSNASPLPPGVELNSNSSIFVTVEYLALKSPAKNYYERGNL